MKILLLIAWRNLKEHRSKTLIIGALVAIGIAVLVIGNSLMETAARGIERSYIGNYTGHLMISGRHQGRLTMFGFQDLSALEQPIPLLPRFEEVLAYVEGLPYVQSANPQAVTNAVASVEEEAQSMALVFGIDPEAYQRTFPDNVQLLGGRFFSPDQDGILLSERTAERLGRRLGTDIEIGDRILLTGISVRGGLRLREVPVSGIFRFRQSNPQLDAVSLLDIRTTRALAGMSLTRVDVADLTGDEQRILGSLDDDELFGSADDLFVELETQDTGTNGDWLFGILEDSAGVEPIEDSSAWHFLLVRLTNERYVETAQRDLEHFFSQQDIDAQVGQWLNAAGAIAELSFGIRWVFNLIVLIIAVVAVIIIMNTLVISVTERMAEIGTMRAIGAQKRFVRSMILWETLLITGIFGTAGIILAVMVLAVLNVTGIEAPNIFFEVLFGGPVLYPVLSASSVLWSFAVILAMAALASLYPASIVMRTPPVQAMESSTN